MAPRFLLYMRFSLWSALYFCPMVIVGNEGGEGSHAPLIGGIDVGESF